MYKCPAPDLDSLVLEMEKQPLHLHSILTTSSWADWQARLTPPPATSTTSLSSENISSDQTTLISARGSLIRAE